MNNLKVTIVIIFLTIFWFPGAVAGEPVVPRILPEVDYGNSLVVFHFKLAPGFHVTDVKHGFFKISLSGEHALTVEEVIYPEGEKEGEERVYRGSFDVVARLRVSSSLTVPARIPFVIEYQICQERPVEMCLAPEKVTVPVQFQKPLTGPGGEGRPSISREGSSFSERISGLFQTKMNEGSWLIFLFAFIAGFIASLTPCVYPVIPIVMGYVGAKSGQSRLRGFTLSLFFSIGLSLVYSILGVIAASTGSLIGAGFQSPLVVIIISLVFLLMGLSMAGLFEISVPAAISPRMQRGEKGGALGAMMIGGISAVIAAPCVGPVLIAILTMISQTGNLVLGFLLTFIFSMGLSVLFIVAGTFSGVISAMPSGGRWMILIKYFFSILLIAGSIFVFSSIVPQWVTRMLWGILLIILAETGGVFRPRGREDSLPEKLGKAGLLVVLLVGTYLVFQGLDGFFHRNNEGKLRRETGVVTEGISWRRDYQAALREAGDRGTIVMLDAYTDWCTACKKLDRSTFGASEVKKELKRIVPLKMDFTRDTPVNRKIREEFGIIGFPTVIFLRGNGDELARFSSYLDVPSFLSRLQEAMRRYRSWDGD